MNGSEKPRRALILEPGSPRPLAEMARILSEVLAIPYPDAFYPLRRSGGLFFPEVEGETGARLSALLAEAGVSVREIDPALLRDLPRGARVRRLAFLEEEIRAFHPGNRQILIPRQSLRGAHLGASIPPVTPPAKGEVSSKSHLDAGEPTNLSPRAAKIRESFLKAGASSPLLALSLVFEPGSAPLRILHEDFDYSDLGERKMHHSLDNFLLLLDDLIRFAPDLWLVDRIRKFLEALDVSDILYFTQEEGQNFERWMQIWTRIQMREEG